MIFTQIFLTALTFLQAWLTMHLLSCNFFVVVWVFFFLALKCAKDNVSHRIPKSGKQFTTCQRLFSFKRKVDGQDTEFEVAPAELALQGLWQRIFLSQKTFSVAGFIQGFAPFFLCGFGYDTDFTALSSFFFFVKWSLLPTSQEYLQLKSLVLL